MQKMDQMGFLAWIIVGAVAGWLASMVVRSSLGLIGDIVVGVVGAFIGGFLFNLIGNSVGRRLPVHDPARPGAQVCDGWSDVGLVGCLRGFLRRSPDLDCLRRSLSPSRLQPRLN